MSPPWSRRAVLGAAAGAVSGFTAGSGCVAPSGAVADDCTDARVIEVEWHYTLPEEDQDKVVVTVSNRASVGGTVAVEFRYHPRPGHRGEPTKRERTTVRVGPDEAVRFTHRLFPPAGGGHRSLDAVVIEQDCGRRSRTRGTDGGQSGRLTPRGR